jgi:rfaE bifunctional protein nucleotidyltransferase chain/domain
MKSKLVSASKAADIVTELQKHHKKVVFTNGCFDIIHAGHVRFLDKAKRFGDFLIIGLNRDDSVHRLKGKGRPVMPFGERALLLSFLTPVDLVVGFGEDTPSRLINRLRPDILVKGADYKVREIVGASEIKAWGGSVKRIALVKGKSSSGIISRLHDTSD